MLFVVVKLVSLMLEPSALLAEAALLGWLLRRRRAGRALLGAAVLCSAALLALPVDQWALRPLEDRFPAITDPPARVDGIVVLGGAIDEQTSHDRGMPVMGWAGDRITSFVALARRYPDARLVFTGGSGSMMQGVATEAEYAGRMFASLGLPPGRVVLEDRSRTTWENAVNARDLVHPKPGEVWVLLTSASHMPRAVGVFRRAGWTVLPWPVGYRTRARSVDWDAPFGLKLSRLDYAAHEWAGLLAYWLRGWSSALFPGPA